MTADRRDGKDTPFGDWLRRKPELDSKRFRLSAIDSDMWVHQYVPRHERGRTEKQLMDAIMLVEIKTFSAKVRYAQSDTLWLVDEAMRKSTIRKDGRRRVLRLVDRDTRGPRFVKVFGVHLLELSTDRPDTSDVMVWDNRIEIDEDQLVRLLRFELDPDRPTRDLDTRRHHAVRQEPTLHLFTGGSEAA